MQMHWLKHLGWRRKTEVQPNPSKSVCKCSSVLAVLIPHNGLADPPTTLKASQPVIIKSRKHNGAHTAESGLFLLHSPRMFQLEELV